MEGVDIEEVVDVPDTPDRLASRHVIARDSVGRDRGDSSAEKCRKRASRDVLFGNRMNGLRAKDKAITENGHGRRPAMNPPKNLNNPNTESSFGHQNERLFRKAIEESSSHRAKHRSVDKGKSISIGKSSNHHDEDIDFYYKMKCDEDAKNSKANRPEDKRKGEMLSNGSSSGSRRPYSVEVLGNGFIESGKTRGEAIVLSPDSPIPLSSPRVTGRKCLVRNGCISPQNVAKVEQHKNRSKNVEPSRNVNVSSSFTQSPLDILSELVADENERGKMKGKAKVTIPDTSKKQNENVFFANTSEEANRVGNGDRNALGSQGIDGWRTTHSRSRKPENPVSEERNSKRIGASVSEAGQSSGRPHREENPVTKRLKTQGQSSTSHSEYYTSTTSVSEDPDVMFLGPPRESMRSRTSRVRRPQSRAMLGPIIEVNDFSPPPAGRSNDDDDSDVRAMQVQADEMLARELQEQLYHETPMVGGGETGDDYLLWAMQQQEEENRSNTSTSRRNASHSRSPVVSQVQRHARRAGLTTRPSRRGANGRALTSSRMAQIRGRGAHRRGQGHASSSRARDLEFPLHMDLEMRLDILQALEDAVGGVYMDNPGLQVQRDFNENDYEMLLALDERNHQHGGASTNLINSLPQSVVQTDNQEDCAVCLETPSIGETVRHLPCLHKFHKDCIDPWLRRKTSCPVCKSSIN